MDHIDKFLNRLNEDDKNELQDRLIEDGVMKRYSHLKREMTELTMLGEWISEAQELIDNYGQFMGISTGYQSIDDLTFGLKGGDLTVLAGQASHGKTLIGNNIAYRMAKAGIPVLFVTLEMTKAKVTSRFMKIAQDDGVDPATLPIYYQSVDWLKASDMYRLINRAVEEAGVQVVIIDHLHFMADRDANDMRREIGSITKRMKQVAVELKLPIVLLAQVKRLQDSKAKPQNNDLKETGYIEQDADIILMVWRDISPDSLDTNAVEIYCTKNRDNGFTADRIKEFYQRGATLYESLSTDLLDKQPFTH